MGDLGVTEADIDAVIEAAKAFEGTKEEAFDAVVEYLDLSDEDVDAIEDFIGDDADDVEDAVEEVLAQTSKPPCRFKKALEELGVTDEDIDAAIEAAKAFDGTKEEAFDAVVDYLDLDADDLEAIEDFIGDDADAVE